MLVSVNLDLQNCFKNQDDYVDNLGAERLFQKQARSKRYLISKTLFCCKMTEYNLVRKHVLILYEYMQRLKTLGVPISKIVGHWFYS